MNTLTELRRTLERHADDIADPATVARTASVHHRIAAVRRRRRAVGAGAAVLVAVTGIATAQLRSEPVTAAGPVVLGQRAPGTMTSLGYTYRATGAARVIHGSGTVVLSESSTPRLLSWTTDRAATVTFVLPGDEVHRTRVTGFQDFLAVPVDVAVRVRVSAGPASVGIATYSLTDAAPSGYTKAGVTYRDVVAGAHLLTAVIGDEGNTSVSSSFVAPHGYVTLGVMCTNLPKGDVVNVSFGNGGPVSSSGCDSDGSFDPGSSSFTGFRSRHPGHLVRVHAWISKGFHDLTQVPRNSVAGSRLGVGVYGPVAQTRVGGVSVPTEIETQGHTWRLSSSSVSTSGRIRTRPASADRVATVVMRTHGHTVVRLRAGSQAPTASESLPGGTGSMPDQWVPAGTTLRVEIARGSGTLGVALYERID
jgi:hypothetical protein